MTDLHLVWSWNAAASLRGALRQRRTVMRADPAPDLGPLDDGRRRGTFFRDLWVSVGASADDFDDDHLREDAYADWDPIRKAAAEMTPDRIVIWTSRSGADHVFLRMAMHFLRDHRARIWQVRVDTGDRFCGVGSLPGATLISFLQDATPIRAPAAETYLAEFDTIAANPGLIKTAMPERGAFLSRPVVL